jgi:hypothetical protein
MNISLFTIGIGDTFKTVSFMKKKEILFIGDYRISLDRKISLVYDKIMENFVEKINIIRETILKNVPARYIYSVLMPMANRPTRAI